LIFNHLRRKYPAPETIVSGFDAASSSP
jgi:hypothetical protein